MAHPHSLPDKARNLHHQHPRQFRNAQTMFGKLPRQIQQHWSILCSLVVAAYITVDLLSNRSSVQVFISHLTFNQHTSYNRILIWHSGAAEVLRNPILGMGLNEWQRAWLMSDNMDNFWLVKAVRYGVPGLDFLITAVIVIGTSFTRLRSRDRRVQNYRKGWFVTVIGLAVAGSKVHYWNAIYYLFICPVGSGVWMLDQTPAKKLLRRQNKLETEADLKKQQRRIPAQKI